MAKLDLVLFESFYYLAPLTAIPGPSPCLCRSCCLCQFLQIFLNNFLDKKLYFILLFMSHCPEIRECVCVCVCVCGWLSSGVRAGAGLRGGGGGGGQRVGGLLILYLLKYHPSLSLTNVNQTTELPWIQLGFSSSGV